jgi:hypothetical protein
MTTPANTAATTPAAATAVPDGLNSSSAREPAGDGTAAGPAAAEDLAAAVRCEVACKLAASCEVTAASCANWVLVSRCCKRTRAHVDKQQWTGN